MVQWYFRKLVDSFAYDKKYQLLRTTMHVRFVDRSTCRVEGIVNDVCVRVRCSYVPVDFVILDTGHGLGAPIIFGRPFLHTAKATIYTGTSDICFHIKDRKERFSYKSRKPPSSNMPRTRPSIHLKKGTVSRPTNPRSYRSH